MVLNLERNMLGINTCAMLSLITKDFKHFVKFILLQLESISSSLPGVAIIILAPAFNFSISSLIVVPPTRITCFNNNSLFKNFANTSLI